MRCSASDLGVTVNEMFGQTEINWSATAAARSTSGPRAGRFGAAGSMAGCTRATVSR
jgi:hypothetical protein